MPLHADAICYGLLTLYACQWPVKAILQGLYMAEGYILIMLRDATFFFLLGGTCWDPIVQGYSVGPVPTLRTVLLCIYTC